MIVCGPSHFGETRMTSQAIRDPVKDHLLTPENCALIIIDYQPVQVTSVASMDRRVLVTNIVSVASLARLFKLPVILSTVNVKTGKNAPTIHQLQAVLPDAEALDRTTINAWEDEQFLRAVKATGRKKLIMTALWTEACLTFPTLDALREGYEVYGLPRVLWTRRFDAQESAKELRCPRSSVREERNASMSSSGPIATSTTCGRCAGSWR